MNIEDCKIGTKVKLISTEVTDEYLGYNSTEMLSIGSVSEVIDNTSDDSEEVKQPLDVPTVASNVDFSDEKLQSMFEEVMKDVMKEYLRDSINTLNKTAFGI